MATESHESDRVITQGRRRFLVAWRDSLRRAIWTIGHLEYEDGSYSFRYVSGADEIPDLRPLVEFPDFRWTYRSEELFPFFAQRVMDHRRPDYAAYLDALALPRDADVLDILGRSGGRRKADKVQVAEIPRAEADGSISFDFLVHGSRFSPAGEDAVSAALAVTRTGDELTLRPEPNNPVSPDALLVVTVDGVPIGWVPELLVPYVQAVREAGGWTLSARRVNGPDTAWHLRVVARVTGWMIAAPKEAAGTSSPATAAAREPVDQVDYAVR